jgi:hypothetical protein
MKNITIQAHYDKDKCEALICALQSKGLSLEGELAGFLDTLFEKNVHKAVQEFLTLKDCAAPKPRPRSKKAPV